MLKRFFIEERFLVTNTKESYPLVFIVFLILWIRESIVDHPVSWLANLSTRPVIISAPISRRRVRTVSKIFRFQIWFRKFRSGKRFGRENKVFGKLGKVKNYRNDEVLVQVFCEISRSLFRFRNFSKFMLTSCVLNYQNFSSNKYLRFFKNIIEN